MSSLSDAPPVLDPTAAVQRYLDAVAAGDQAAMLDCFTEDATWTIFTDLPLAGPWTGREAIVHDFLGQMSELFEPGSVHFVNGAFIAQGDTVVHEWTAHARSATGERFDDACCGIFEVRDGRIASVREYLDSRHVGRVLFGERS